MWQTHEKNNAMGHRDPDMPTADSAAAQPDHYYENIGQFSFMIPEGVRVVPVNVPPRPADLEPGRHIATPQKEVPDNEYCRLYCSHLPTGQHDPLYCSHTPEPKTVAQPDFEDDLAHVLENLRTMLLAKNEAYGNSALDPVRIFARDLSTDAQIRVRIDDKLSRLARGQAAGEDVIADLMGYLVLLRIAQRRAQP